MRRGATLTGAAMAAALLAGPARAEVRLVESPLDRSLVVDILSTPVGPWTPTGAVNEFVLNPSGDLFGDGMPGWDTRVTSVLSAWIRPGVGTLNRALGEDDGWAPLDGIPAMGAIGQPVVDVMTDGWSVAWQQVELSTRRILVTGTLPDGTAVSPVDVATGLLLGTAPNGNMLHVISLDPATGILWCTTVAFAFIPTQPIPITIEIVARVQLGRLGQLDSGPRSQGGGPRKGSDPGSIATADPRVHDTTDASGELSQVVTWWSGSTLYWVEIGDDGPVLPAATVGWRNGRGGRERALDTALQLAAEQ